jgi:serine/threonine protein kinase
MNFDIKKNCIKVGKQISKGGFGCVYFAKIDNMIECKNNSNIFFTKLDANEKPNTALKRIKHSESRGVDSVCELYILNKIHHPHILNCYISDINKDGGVEILLPLACGDLSILRKNKIKLPLNLLKKWCWQITTAIAHLNSFGIIHADIKPGNVLLYGDISDLENITLKVSDYSLSIVVPNPKLGTYDIDGWHSYTSTFRPIEIWQKEKWSYPAEIWALGCTFYEMLYGVVLFHDQGNVKNETELAIGAIVDFSKKNLHHTYEYEYLPPKNRSMSISLHNKSNPIPIPIPPVNIKIMHENFKEKLNFKPCNLSDNWHNKDNNMFNELILSMLDINPLKRITIWELLEHPYFDEVYDNNMVPRKKSFPYIAYGIEQAPKNIIDEFEKYKLDNNVCSIALSLYLRSRTDSFNDPKIETCILIAHKLLYKSGPKNFHKPTYESRIDEAKLCQILNFNLLP